MNELEHLFVVLICHLIGDYVLQSDYIAKTKGSNWYHLFVHCVLYIVPFWAAFGPSIRMLTLFVNHFVIDLLKSRYKVISYSQDQFFHYLDIVVVAPLLYRGG